MVPHRYDEELLALETRIRRLALSCGVDLGRRDLVVSLIKGDFSACGSGEHAPRQELRGLLMLKYRIEESCVADLGAGDCLRIIEEEEDRLHRKGFS